MKNIILTTASLFTFSLSYSQNINTIAGNGTAGFSGDAGPAVSAELHNPGSVAVDASGNIYIADISNNRIRKISSTGTITTIAGNGTAGYSGDGAAATAAELNAPQGIHLDASGNLYIADFNNNRVRMVNTSGIITTVAGNGTGGYSGDGAAATAAEIYGPTGIAKDAAGNIYIADYLNSFIRKVDKSGIITTIAGNGTSGYSGDWGPATSAELWSPAAVTIDSSGNIYIADEYNNRIRRINPDGIIYTIVGDSSQGYAGDGGSPFSAELDFPTDVKVDIYGNIYIADFSNERIRIVDVADYITNTIAGDGFASFSGDGGAAKLAALNGPAGIAIDNLGNLYIADYNNNRVREVTSAVGINELKVESEKLKVYPNPSNGLFTIKSPAASGQSSVQVYNMLGQQVYSQYTLPNTQYQIDISNQPTGIYFYRLISENGNLIGAGKLVVE